MRFSYLSFKVLEYLQEFATTLGRYELPIRPPCRADVGATSALLNVKLGRIFPNGVPEFADLFHESPDVGDRVIEVGRQPGAVVPAAQELAGGDDVTFEIFKADFPFIRHPHDSAGRFPILSSNGIQKAAFLDEFTATR